MCNMFYLHLMRVYYNKANRTVFLIGRLLQQLNLLQSPIIYDSLFSLEIVEVISDNLSANRSMSACGCVFGRYITPTIIDFF